MKRLQYMNAYDFHGIPECSSDGIGSSVPSLLKLKNLSKYMVDHLYLPWPSGKKGLNEFLGNFLYFSGFKSRILQNQKTVFNFRVLVL